MIVLTILAALSAAPALRAASTTAAPGAPAGIRATSSAAPDSARVPGRLDSVVALPEVRVEGERPARSARTRLPTAFASDLRAGTTGHALETIPELLRQAPGVRVIEYGGLGAFSTVSLRGAPAGQVSVFLDGAPLTSASHGVVNLSDVPAGAVERVEVYRGVSPLTLGSATPGGAVNLVTLAARERLDGRVARGSFDTWDGRATAGLNRGKVRGALHAGWQSSDGDFRYYDDNATSYTLADDEVVTRVNNRFESASALATLVLEPARGVSVTARENLVRRQQGVPGLGAVPAVHASLRSQRSLTQLEVASAPRGRVPGARLEGALSRERTQSADLTGALGLGRHDTEDRFGSDQVSLALTRPARLLSIEASGSLREERAELHDAADGRPDPPRSERTTRGVALALQLRPSGERVVLHAARRWERVEDHLRTVTSLGRPQALDVTREIVSPQLGARIGIAAGLEARANWSRAERPPDFMELFGNQGSVLGNAALKPERGESWDAGARWAAAAFGISGALEWSHFESDTRDLIVYVENSQSSVKALNVGRGVIRGEEVSLTADMPWRVSASAALTLQETRDRGPVRAYYGKRLPLRADRMATARLEYRGARLTAGADLDYLGDNYLTQYNQQEKWVASRTLVGAWLSVAALGEGLRLTVEGKNLGDRGVSDIGGYPLPGRSLFVSCEMRLTHN